MSITVFIIAAAHAIPVLIARVIGGKVGAFAAAIIMSGVALFAGKSQYAVLDLAAIWLAFIFF